MTGLFHLAFMGRKARQIGGVLEFLDGLPPPTPQEIADAHDAALAEWNRQQNPPKRWPDAEAFAAEFTMDELAAVSLSTDPMAAAMRFLLSTWRSEVHSDDARVRQGMTALFLVGIISEQRMTEILS